MIMFRKKKKKRMMRSPIKVKLKIPKASGSPRMLSRRKRKSPFDKV